MVLQLVLQKLLSGHLLVEHSEVFDLARQLRKACAHLLVRLVLPRKRKILHTSDCLTIQHHIAILDLKLLASAILHHLQLHNKVQLHSVTIGITTPIVAHLIEESSLELFQLLALNIAISQILAVDIRFGRSLLAKLLCCHVELLDGELARFGVEYGKEHIAGTHLVVVLVLFATVVKCRIVVLPLEELEVDTSLLVCLIQFAYKVAKSVAVILQLLR